MSCVNASVCRDASVESCEYRPILHYGRHRRGTIHLTTCRFSSVVGLARQCSKMESRPVGQALSAWNDMSSRRMTLYLKVPVEASYKRSNPKRRLGTSLRKSFMVAVPVRVQIRTCR